MFLAEPCVDHASAVVYAVRSAKHWLEVQELELKQLDGLVCGLLYRTKVRYVR